MRRLPSNTGESRGSRSTADGTVWNSRAGSAGREEFLRREVLVVEIGRNRGKLERAFPRLPFIWPETSAGYDCVFVLNREDLTESALQ